jgi:hypothetical protein
VLAKDGIDGTNVASLSLYQRTATSTPPSAPGATLTYTFATAVISGTLGSWTQSVPTSGGAYLWVIQATALAAAGTATDSITGGEWTSARLVSQNGADGIGTEGLRGSITAYSTVTSEFQKWDARTGGRARWCGDGTLNETNAAFADAAATAKICAVLGLSNSTSNLRVGDTVSLQRTNVDPDITATGFWDGTKWAHPGTFIDGNLLVSGSVSASAINAAGIGTLTIAADAVTIPVGIANGTDFAVGTGWSILLQRTINSGATAPTTTLLAAAVAFNRATAGTAGTFTDVQIALCVHTGTSAVVNTGGSEQIFAVEGSKFYDSKDVITVPVSDTRTLAINTNYTYSLQIRKLTTPTNNTFTTNGQSLWIVGAKR